MMTGRLTRTRVARILTGLVIATAIAGCSIERLAINSLSNVLAEGNSVFERDNDPQLIAEALPFSLKLIDALLLETPENTELLLAAASGYVFYAYANVTIEAERMNTVDIDAARALRARARNLFLRAHEYASKAIATQYPQLPAALRRSPQDAALTIDARSSDIVESVYWYTVSLSLAISSARNDPALLARSGEVAALVERALEIDPSWGEGSVHELAITAAPLANVDSSELNMHFEQALSMSGGKRASLFVAYAEATAVPDQDRETFVELLERALDVNVDSFPALRLVNTVAQRRAKWLLDQLDMLFLD